MSFLCRKIRSSPWGRSAEYQEAKSARKMSRLRCIFTKLTLLGVLASWCYQNFADKLKRDADIRRASLFSLVRLQKWAAGSACLWFSRTSKWLAVWIPTGGKISFSFLCSWFFVCQLVQERSQPKNSAIELYFLAHLRNRYSTKIRYLNDSVSCQVHSLPCDDLQPFLYSPPIF